MRNVLYVQQDDNWVASSFCVQNFLLVLFHYVSSLH